jgi:hypothetical protein
MYTRYTCYGPDIRFKSGKADLWVASERYSRSAQINFLRPATRWELEVRPHGNILSTCKTVYEEAVPILYRGRNFLLLTGPCPRGRYQALATHIFLARLTPLARSHVTTISLLSQSYEEDCSVEDVGPVYAELAAYMAFCLPSFKTLCVTVLDERLKTAVEMLRGVYEKEGVVICLTMGSGAGTAFECSDVQGFEVVLQQEIENMGYEEYNEGEDFEQASVDEHSMEGVRSTDQLGQKVTSQPQNRIKDEQVHSIWEEVHEEANVPEFEHETIESMYTRLRAQKEAELPKSLKTVRLAGSSKMKVTTLEREPYQPGLRRRSRVPRSVPKTRGEEKDQTMEQVQEVEDVDNDEDEWFDAAMSPAGTESGKDGDAENWEVL